MLHRCALALTLSVCLGAATLPTPQQFAGFRMGTDKKLVRWDKIVEYMKLAASSSNRVKFEELGKTTNGHPFVLVTIASPASLATLDQTRAAQKRLANPRGLAAADADALIRSQKGVLLITLNIHSTEIGSTQMALDLVHRLATEESPYVQHILDNVVLLLVPSFNPDGQIMVTDWYNKNAGTPFEYSAMPELYHKYTGHDNNRDAFMNTQIESQYVNKLMYKDWFPAVYLDEHQMGSQGPRIFVPPFKNPINPNVDPLIWQWNGTLGYAMGAELHAKGYTGIINDAMYTSWWQGGFVMQAWWHNMVGLLTEVASVAVATPIEQQIARPGTLPPPELSPEQLRSRDPRSPLPPPRQTAPSNTYPRPWMGGKWTLRNIVDYELAATYGLLEAVANNRVALNRSFYEMGRKQIELGETTAPYAWVIPAEQHDRAAAARMLQILDELGVEVERASDSFKAGDKTYPAGSHVVRMAQPYRGFAKDMLEKQTYPAQRPCPSCPVERPYDVTGWTLPYQMGVTAVAVDKKFDAKLARVGPVPVPEGKVEAAGSAIVWEISPASNNAAIAVNRLLKAGATVGWTPKGAIVARSREDLSPKLREWSRALSIDAKGLSTLPPQLRRLKAPRVGLYQPWFSNMDEGWTRWLLEQYEFPYKTVRNETLKTGKLRDSFDVILFADQPKDSILKGVETNWTRPEYKGGIGAEGVEALKEFARAGGTVVMLGSSSLVAIEEFPLPLRNTLKGLRPDQFSCPGSILKVFVDNQHPAGYGMRDAASAVFYNDIAYEAAPSLGDSQVKVIARYPSSGLLESGWIGGEEHLQDKIAAAEVTYGSGRVIAIGFSAQNRAQPHGTFKLLFNSLFYGGAE